MNISNLKKRLFFALWAVPLGWWVVNSNFSILRHAPDSIGTAFEGITVFPGHLLTIVITFIGASEYIKMLSRLYPRNGFWVIYIWLLYQVISYFIPDNFLTMTKDIYLLLLVIAIEAFLWGRHTTGRWKRASLLFSGTSFLVIACISMLDFYNPPFQKIFVPVFEHTMLSQLGIVTVLSAIFLCDSTAFFVGSLWGKHHFSSISPKKTIEGGIAGIAMAILITGVGWWFLADDKYPCFLGIIMGLFIGVFAQVGDLFVSHMKRYFDVKDSSNIIPGHGGILDRFDSLFFTAPVVNLFIIVVYMVVN